MTRRRWTLLGLALALANAAAGAVSLSEWRGGVAGWDHVRGRGPKGCEPDAGDWADTILLLFLPPLASLVSLAAAFRRPSR